MTSDATHAVPNVVRAFEERRTLTRSLSHREHVMIAWHYARTLPAPQALAELARGIQELAVALGKEGLYHETLRSSPRQRRTFSPGALEPYYDRAVLDSGLTRSVCLMPDGRSPKTKSPE